MVAVNNLPISFLLSSLVASASALPSFKTTSTIAFIPLTSELILAVSPGKASSFCLALPIAASVVAPLAAVLAPSAILSNELILKHYLN
ncbi:hypothetical protein BHO_0900052 (plasmid) [Borrelia hermsii YBT]|uniref:Variable outer membrane protein n=1 Tax=Borrelia hermsii YBT TaxID=1313295 RepID=W5T7D0_BORHE|nr:hypothetical protein BHO_0900052 [Borrelia hermsii YBT]